jgi:hypothetical protein
VAHCAHWVNSNYFTNRCILLLCRVTRCDTSGLVAGETPSQNNSAGVLDAEVKGRVPQSYVDAIDADVRKRKQIFPRASRADVLRDALSEYFAKHSAKKNGKAVARA